MRFFSLFLDKKRINIPIFKLLFPGLASFLTVDSIAKSKSIFTFIYLPNVVLYWNFYLVSNKSICFLDYVEIVG